MLSIVPFFSEIAEDKHSNISENMVSLEYPSSSMDTMDLMDSSWPMKCHDLHHTGLSPYSTMDTDGTLKWRFDGGWVEAGSIIDDEGTIYFGSFNKNLYAVYPNGTLKWKYKTNDWIWSTPALDNDGTIYLGTFGSTFYAIYPDGTLKWTYYTGGPISSSPAIDDDGMIYFGTFRGSDGDINALYPNGTLKWKYKTNDWIWSTPALDNDGTIYLGTFGSTFYAIYPDGTLKWTYYTGGPISSSPAIDDDGMIYFGTFRGSDGDINALYPNGTRKWKYTTDYYITSDPAIGDDGTIYIGSGDTYLYAMHPDGSLRWRFKTDDYIKGHPSIDKDGTIYICSFDHHLYAINPDGTLKWKYDGTRGGSSSVSIGKDGTLYVAGDNKLLALNPDGTDKWSFDLGNRYIGKSSPAISDDGTIYIGVNIGNEAGGEIIAINSDGTEQWRSGKIAYTRLESSPSIGRDGTVYIGSSSTVDGNNFGYLHAFGSGELKAYCNGPYYGLVNQLVSFDGDASGGHQPYTWYWDFGDGQTSSEQDPVHRYEHPGNYTVTVTVTDDEHTMVSDTSYALIQESNNPPDNPMVSGTINGKKGVYYEYTISGLDPEDNPVFYFVDWGDGSNSSWRGPFASGETLILRHSWDAMGSYTIKARAMDVFGAESDWTILPITMPKHSFFGSLIWEWFQHHFFFVNW